MSPTSCRWESLSCCPGITICHAETAFPAAFPVALLPARQPKLHVLRTYVLLVLATGQRPYKVDGVVEFPKPPRDSKQYTLHLHHTGESAALDGL